MPVPRPPRSLLQRLARPFRRATTRLVWPDAVAHAACTRVVCHEWFTVVGGSDKVAARLAQVTDAEVVYTFAHDPACTAALGLQTPVVTWRFGQWAARGRRFQALLPIMPLVWRHLDLTGTDRVVTSSHSCVNAIRTPQAHRTCYCHTPMRYAWDWRLERGRAPRLFQPALPAAAALLRWADRRWSRRVDVYIANSRFVADRIGHAYGRDAAVVHPPVEVDRWRPCPPIRAPTRQSYVVAGRLVAYKRADLAVRAANMAGVPLVVAGNGPELPRLRLLAGPTVKFEVDPDDEQLMELVRDARALVFPGIEDFGILPVEAQACGTPVIARHEGGAAETVLDGITGLLLGTDDPETWSIALARFDPARLDPAAARQNAERFRSDLFTDRIRSAIAADQTGTLDP